MQEKHDQNLFDVDFARQQFPFFELDRSKKLDQSKKWSFFDNAGGTFACRSVVDKLMYFYQANKVQP
jgi:selenocysteine lyase/cysteine desulfurase